MSLSDIKNIKGLNIPSWFARLVVIVALIAPPSAAVKWASDVNVQLARIEEQLVSKDKLVQVIVDSHAERIEENAADIARLNDRLNKHIEQGRQ